MKTLFLISALLLSFFPSCKKEDKNNNTSCDKTMKGISGSYSLVKYEIAPANGSFSEKPVAACMVDDQLILKSDGTTQYIDAGVSCAQNLIAGSWSVSTDNKITISAGPPFGTVTNATINSFDCTTLIISTVINGSTLRLTLKK